MRSEVFGPFVRGWFSNLRRGMYHAEGDNWIRDGLALCGARITHPGWTTGREKPAPHLRACKHCLRKLESATP